MLSVGSMVAKRLYLVAVISAVSALSLLCTAHPSTAATKQFERVLSMVGMQQMLTQKMSKDMLLIALEVDKEKHLKDLETARSLFDRTLTGLRYGDAELALEGTSHAEVLASLDRVDEIWPLFSAALQNGTASDTVSPDTISLVSDLNLPLLAAMDDTITSYENAASASPLRSMLHIAIVQAGQQRMLSQKIAKEFLLIAYGHDIKQNRQRLGESSMAFEKILNGLTSGDAELRLVPTPNPRIQAQLKTITRLWDAFKPILQSAIAGTPINDEDLAEVVSLNLAMLSEINSAIDLYEAL